MRRRRAVKLLSSERFGFGLRDDFFTAHALGTDVAQIKLFPIEI